jgi:hypothetical protein
MSNANELPPPWVKHPEIPAGSIGWRMGYGEGFLVQWHEWLAQQPKDRTRRAAYLRRHATAPRTWAQTVAYVLEPDREDEQDDDDDDGDELEGEQHEALVAEGLVGDDVAMGAWEAIHGEAPEAPWAMRWHGGKLGSAARYGGRELTFWARWCAKRRSDGRLDAWLRSAPNAGPAWKPMRNAVRHGAVPSDWSPASAWERLGVLIAAHGEAPPPWVLGESPGSLGGRHEDDSSYADAWCSWHYEAFDDRKTWRAYLERHGGIPDAWREPISGLIYIGE